MNAKTRKAREYMYSIIMPASPNCSGIRWYAYIGTGLCLKADTLAGIKQLIRHYRETNT